MLEIRMLGEFAVLDGDSRVELRSRQAQRVLAYVAIRGVERLPRAAVAAALWPDAQQHRSMANLRQGIWRLRQTLGDCVITAGSTLGLDPAVQTDVDRLRSLPLTAAPELSMRVLGGLRGELLPGWYEDWVVEERAAIDAFIEAAYGHLFQALNGDQRWADLASWAERRLALGGTSEAAYRALMHAAAGRGDVSGIAAAYRRCSERLAREYATEPSQQTESVYLDLLNRPIGRPQTSSDVAGSSTAVIPLPSAPFIGRSRQLVKLGALVDDPAVRLITITGPGGVGKTRLAIQMLAIGAEPRAHGAHLVRMAKIQSIDRAAVAIGAAVGARLEDRRPAIDQLIDRLRDREMVIVLDGLDQFRHAAELTGAVIDVADGVTLLATSRTRLGHPAEVVFELEGLGFDPPGPGSSEAAEMFAVYARRSAPGLQVDGDVVDRICAAVQGLPLAIELAATWVRSLSIAGVAERVTAHVRSLEASGDEIDARHRSLRVVFDQSWILLEDEDRDALRRLAVFPGDFDPASAKAVAGVAPGMLEGLAEKSLLHRTGLGRFGFHDVIRRFAGERLSAWADLEAEVATAHSNYYMRLLFEAFEDIRGGTASLGFATIDADFDNIRSAWIRAAETSAFENFVATVLGGDRSELWKAFSTLMQYCVTRSLGDEIRDLLDLALEALTPAGFGQPGSWLEHAVTHRAMVTIEGIERSDLARTVWTHVAEAPDGGSLGLMKVVLLAYLDESSVASIDADRIAASVLAETRKGDDPWIAGIASAAAATTALSAGYTAKATALYEQAVAVLASIGEHLVREQTLRALAELDLAASEPLAALRRLDVARELGSAMGARRRLAAGALVRSRAMGELGRYSEARSVAVESADHFGSIGATADEASALVAALRFAVEDGNAIALEALMDRARRTAVAAGEPELEGELAMVADRLKANDRGEDPERT